MSKKGQIFIVDNNPYSVDLLRELLENNGYVVQCADSAKEAFKKIPAVQPDLILLDVQLPDINGFTFREQLKENDQTCDIPVIFMSALDDIEAKLKGFEKGDDHLTKPFESPEVLARVERQVTVSQVRTALRESEAKFQSVMESAIDAIISADVKGLILSWNRAAAVLFGYSSEEMIGQPVDLIIPERFRKMHQEGIRRVSSGGTSNVIGKTVELAAIHKGGVEFPVELSLATWILDDKRYYTGIIRDIRERKQAEQKFRSVTESAIDAIISANHTGQIISWNSAATAILEFSSDEVIGQNLEIIIPERFHEAHRQGMRRVTEGGESRVIGKTVELFARTKSGKEVPIELSLSTWTVHEERYYTGIIRDISERKEAEKQLRDYTNELAQQHEELKLAQSQLIESEKQAMLGRLFAGLLHEFNTPLGALRSAGDSIRRILENCRSFITEQCTEDDPALGETLQALGLGDKLSDVFSVSTQRIENVILSLSHLVNLDGAEYEPHDLRHSFNSVITLMIPHAGDRVRIVRHFPDEPVLVHCNPARLNHAFLNLLQNAIEAIEDQGEIQISVKLKPDRVKVLISDNGCGMSPEHLSDAFDFKFTKKKGRVRLGLGLATSKRAIEHADGKLKIESAPNKGTQVYLDFPRTKVVLNK